MRYMKNKIRPTDNTYRPVFSKIGFIFIFILLDYCIIFSA